VLAAPGLGGRWATGILGKYWTKLADPTVNN
jgi:hypothetical protein